MKMRLVHFSALFQTRVINIHAKLFISVSYDDILGIVNYYIFRLRGTTKEIFHSVGGLANLFNRFLRRAHTSCARA